VLSGLRRDLLGVDEAVAAHPDAVIRLRQIGDDVSATLVGHDDLGKAGAKVSRLGDDPHSVLGAKAAGDGAANRLVIDSDRRRTGGLPLTGWLGMRHAGIEEKSDGSND
jgi:hypothetical protein